MHHEICTIIDAVRRRLSYRFTVAILLSLLSAAGATRGMVVTSICGGFLAFIGFRIIGHPYAALMAIFTGIMHLVPVVGSLGGAQQSPQCSVSCSAPC
ncbi:MAG: AI-2E family transporter [Collinsella sp.]